jgi:hypothetical protein
MATSLEKLTQEARLLPEVELLRRTSTLIPMAEEHIAARAELARRERARNFWRKDIVAWAALLLAIVSLLVSLSRYAP